MFTFEESTNQELNELIKLADTEKIFLPSAKEGAFVVKDFLEQHSLSTGYHIFTVKSLVKESISFISIWPYKDQGIAIGPMFVKKEYRGKGVGAFQLEKILDWAKQQRFKQVFIKTWGQNIASRKIIENLKFDLIKEIPHSRINGDSTVEYIYNIF